MAHPASDHTLNRTARLASWLWFILSVVQFLLPGDLIHLGWMLVMRLQGYLAAPWPVSSVILVASCAAQGVAVTGWVYGGLRDRLAPAALVAALVMWVPGVSLLVMPWAVWRSTRVMLDGDGMPSVAKVLAGAAAASAVLWQADMVAALAAWQWDQMADSRVPWLEALRRIALLGDLGGASLAVALLGPGQRQGSAARTGWVLVGWCTSVALACVLWVVPARGLSWRIAPCAAPNVWNRTTWGVLVLPPLCTRVLEGALIRQTASPVAGAVLGSQEPPVATAHRAVVPHAAAPTVPLECDDAHLFGGQPLLRWQHLSERAWANHNADGGRASSIWALLRARALVAGVRIELHKGAPMVHPQNPDVCKGEP